MFEAKEISKVQPSLHDTMREMGHEQVVFCNDHHTGLQAIIAIHNTVLGPGMGGTRLWNYTNYQDAVVDALRLSRGMTFKNAVAGLNIGGGKAVIIGKPEQKTEAFLRRFGRFIDTLGGRYVTAEDVGMTTQDMSYIAMETSAVAGLPEAEGGGGNPSPVTAYGVYMGMKAAAKKAYGSDSLTGKKIWVQGAGNVGGHLVKLVAEEGAKVMVSDLQEKRAAAVAKSYKAQVIPGNSDLGLDMDIYAPCALGATLDSQSIPNLKCQIIAGGANNQLRNEVEHAQMLKDREIIYAPDFLINSGGIINVYLEYKGKYNRELAYQKTQTIYDTCLKLIDRSRQLDITTHEAALQIARDRIEKVGKVKLSF